MKADNDYQKLLQMAKQLDLAQQLRLIEELALSIRRQAEVSPRRSILELQGVGQEIWKEIDVTKHVEEERASWDG
ncbi:hypothetical protein [Calderihabitans maritimus]|uniref:Uncharacterized protein n=1 Tax=Calderihabitans maritimus TaxID=1246530 RepID=A0A1Z5HWT6_9FIRM|nr:hypothetical protein [Calderihabitans maritimus]GAW93989.1 hypothetical protein ANA_C10687 [Calderihabitans maritimus]